MSPLRVVLADDHGLVRAGLRALLAELPDVEVVAETGEGQEALRLIVKMQPDVALVDVSMPGLNGIDVALRAAKENPRTRVLILSMHDDDEFVRRALVAGAAGYLVKNADPAELELALRAVARGDTWLSPAVSRTVASTFARGERSRVEGPFEVLSTRQREVLQLIAEGLSTKEIAARLDLGIKTVETHRTDLMHRLGIRGLAGLVRYAVRAGLVHSEP